MQTRRFGRTGHQSSVAIFGAAALWSVTQAEADKTMELVIAAEHLALPVGAVVVVRPAAEDLPLEVGRPGELRVGTGRFEARDHEAVDLPRRVGHGQVDRADAEALVAEDFPDGLLANLICAVEG